MAELEYEVVFVYELVNISTLVYITDEYVGDTDNDHYETIESKAVAWAQIKVEEQTGLDIVLRDLIDLEVKHTGTIGG